jgi:hypothetical protein
MFKIFLTAIIFSLSFPVYSNDDEECHVRTLMPDGKIRDGYDTTNWVNSILWENGAEQAFNNKDHSPFTFGCAKAYVNVVDQPGKPGDFAVFQNTFGFDLDDFPSTMAQFEFTLEVDNLVSSYGHQDSFSLFRVYRDENDLNTVMLNLELIRIQTFTKPGTKPATGDGWLMEISFINQKDGSTYIKYHPIQGDQADVFYRWDGDAKMASTYMIITDEGGESRYDSKVPDASTVVPRINRLGMVDAATPFAIGDQIVLRGPMPRNQ